MAGFFVCKIDASATPNGRSRPEDKSEWLAGEFDVPLPRHPEVEPERMGSGAKVWIWCDESPAHGSGLGLTGIGILNTAVHEANRAKIRFGSLDLFVGDPYRKPLGMDRFLDYVPDQPVLTELGEDGGERTRYLTPPEAHAWQKAIDAAHAGIEADRRTARLRYLAEAPDTEFFRAIDRRRTPAETRPEQAAFRAALLRRDGACAVTGCAVPEALEGARIVPFRDGGPERDNPENGLLLRADIHRLFDAERLRIDPETRTARLSEALAETEYADLEGREIRSGAGDIFLILEAERRARRGE